LCFVTIKHDPTKNGNLINLVAELSDICIALFPLGYGYSLLFAYQGVSVKGFYLIPYSITLNTVSLTLIILSFYISK